jgi:hypothetical protein
MFKYLTVIVFLVGASAVFAIIPIKAPVEAGAAVDGFRSDGTYNFYYYGTPAWQWTFPAGGYTGVDFDPEDNEGDTTSNPYEVTYVDSLWNYEPDGSYNVVLYICEDDNGEPDFDNPLYESDPYEPDYYSDWDEHEVSPPVQFNGGEICWVVFSVPSQDGHPISDNDGNSGHSWISSDGYDWELMDAQGGVDWCVEVYAEPGEPPDDTDPYITDTYPVNDDWPSGIPPIENTAGCHWQDGDPDTNEGIDVDASSFDVYDGSMDVVSGTLDIDDSDLYDVIVDFQADDPWEEGATYTVETETFDLAGNSASDEWTFDVGYTDIAESSFGAIKAGFR